jgi:hypothetical protein
MKIEIKKSELIAAGVKDGWFVAVDADGRVCVYSDRPIFQFYRCWDVGRGEWETIRKSTPPKNAKTAIRQYKDGKLVRVNQ